MAISKLIMIIDDTIGKVLYEISDEDDGYCNRAYVFNAYFQPYALQWLFNICGIQEIVDPPDPSGKDRNYKRAYYYEIVAREDVHAPG